ncbi:MAG: efflux RND transporter permease subunit [Planctomycetes bacterium]|nr:efflux RND transporter permease subunit [Planctomycetota bacterium]
MLSSLVRFCLEQRLVVVLLLVLLVGAGVFVAPFDWDLGDVPRDPVPVDAIPDLGENQQIVYSEWMGRSPQDVEDQITYPLTVQMLGVPGVSTVRSTSYFGFSTISVLFEEGVDTYWARSRILEKLASLPADALPQGVRPALGPDATPLGQVFWYTLEGRDDQGRPTGGWDLDELRSLQDWTVRYALLSADGVAEVASVGGYVREYQVDVDPDAMRAHRITLEDVFAAVRDSNLEVGARVLEINHAEYFVRSLGWIASVDDLEDSVIKSVDGVPIRVRDVGHVSLGPALRRGALDKGGAGAVGGVVVVRQGENPLAVIGHVKDKIAEIAPGLPRRTLDDGTVSHVEIVPFYDRSGLINQTLHTLDVAISDEILVTILVVLAMVRHLRSSLLIAALLPVAVLFAFVCMKLGHVDANIVALSGIAIAIGTMVDMGIVLCENILRRLEEAAPDAPPLETVWHATTEVGSAVATAVATTVVGFLPVFTMSGAEGKLFGPLAWTKTFALVGSLVVALLVIPSFALWLFPRRGGRLGAWFSRAGTRRPRTTRLVRGLFDLALLLVVSALLARHWEPLGVEHGVTQNLLFVLLSVFGLLAVFLLVQRTYAHTLRFCLEHKSVFLVLPAAIVLFGALAWLGTERVLGFVPTTLASAGIDEGAVRASSPWTRLARAFPGLGQEFMPPLDEGSYLFMPTTMPHASMGEALDVLARLDMAIETVPEVELAVGKIGRVDSALDPAPISMLETVVNVKPEYRVDADGRRLGFAYDEQRGAFLRDAHGDLVADPDGRPFRNWRPEIRSPDDVWRAVVEAARLPGTTSAPRLQPIAARLVMLQSGMRAPLGVKIKGPDLATLEQVGLQIERLLEQVPSVDAGTVLADRVVGKPYLEIAVDRVQAARYGVTIAHVQEVIEIALGGRSITSTVEGRERYPVRVRYLRELRDSIEAMGRVLVPTPDGAQIPLDQLAEIRYTAGPQAIKTEDTFLTSYVIFDKQPDAAEVDVVEACRRHLEQALADGELQLPPGTSFAFAGSYENQVRASRTLAIVLPLALLLIFLILYLQFRAVPMTLLVFLGVFVAWAGGFVLVWMYGQPWFLDVHVFGVDLRELFSVRTVNLSVAVWVGFLALFGIATDDGVVVGTYLQQSFRERRPGNVREVREAVHAAGLRRVRPCLMTTATTLLALLPVLTSRGRGSDVMLPMAIPGFGGMAVETITMFLVPVLYCAVEERRVRKAARAA